MNFYKISGTENSFFFVNGTDIDRGAKQSTTCGLLKTLNPMDLAKTLCSRIGTGADGLVIVKQSDSSEFDYEWDFYNKDGSRAELCGNASRCMALYVRDFLGFNKTRLIFKSIAGKILVEYLEDNLFRVRMPDHRIEKLWVNETIDNINFNYCFINTGVPHAVLHVPQLEREKLLPIVKLFRFKSEFGEAGANVSFICENNGLFEGVTFERGIEDFTKSCGTGVVAMALAIINHPVLNAHIGDPSLQNTIRVKIRTPGGDLSVELSDSKKFCQLTGPAQFVEYIECFNEDGNPASQQEKI